MSSSSRFRFSSLTVAMHSSTSPASEYRLRGREWVGGSGRRLVFDELDTISAHAEALRIGFGDVQVDLVFSAMDFGDFVHHLIVGRIKFVANLWHRR
jgi:hypothetical protein